MRSSLKKGNFFVAQAGGRAAGGWVRKETTSRLSWKKGVISAFFDCQVAISRCTFGKMYPSDVIYDIQQQFSPKAQRPAVDMADPLLLQARNILEECSNYQESKQLALRNRECMVYLTQEVQKALQGIPARTIDAVINDGTHHGMQRYVLAQGTRTHEFWVLKKYHATLLHDNFTSYNIVAPYVYDTRKHGSAFFAKRTAAALCSMGVFIAALICAVVLTSELASWIAAGICIFAAGFNFLFLLRLYKKYKHNPIIRQCAIDELLANEHSIPHVMFTTDDTSDVL